LLARPHGVTSGPKRLRVSLLSRSLACGVKEQIPRMLGLRDVVTVRTSCLVGTTLITGWVIDRRGK